MTHLAELVTAVAAKTGRPEDEVESLLLLHGVPEHAVQTAGRHLQLRRLRVRGTKDLHDGPVTFDRTFYLRPGLTVVTGENLRGKTTILELITLMLRGSARSLQPDVLAWLETVSLDIDVNSQSLGLRLRLDGGRVAAGVILEGDPDSLAAADDDPGGCDVVDSATDDADWQRVVDGQMLGRMGLEPIRAYAKVGGREVGNVQSHGWPAYFAAIYPPAGADTVLLGSDTGTGLSTRLLDVFLDLPGAALRARLSAARQMLKAQDDARRAQAGATVQALADRTAAARAELESARAALRAAEPNDSAADVSAAREVLAAARAAQDQAVSREAETAVELAAARAGRIADRRALNALIEDAAAGALFHGLNPTACPRCESRIDEDRRRLETESHSCAVCARPVVDSDGVNRDSAAERRRDAERATAASEQAERLLQAAVDAAVERSAATASAIDAAEDAVQRAVVAQDDSGAELARRAVAAAEGAVAALESVQPPVLEQDTVLAVLDAAQAVLTEALAGVARELLDELSTDIADLGRAFGIANLESVDLKRNLNMPVTKGGGRIAPFGRQSAGERLRLRYALLVALLRIGRRRSIASHPGLLLLDSIRAEEVQDNDAEQLLAALADACRDEPNLQILVTTQDASLPGRLSPPAATIAPGPGEDALF